MQDTEAVPQTILPKRRRGILECKVRDELLLFAPPEEDAITLNQSGRAIWELCDGQHTVLEMFHALRQRYECSDIELFADLTTTLLQLRDLDLVELGNHPKLHDDRTLVDTDLPV